MSTMPCAFALVGELLLIVFVGTFRTSVQDLASFERSGRLDLKQEVTEKHVCKGIGSQEQQTNLLLYPCRRQ